MVQLIVHPVRNSKPRVLNNRHTRRAAQQASKFLSFADALATHEFETSADQQRRALLGLSKLAVQQMLTERLLAVPFGEKPGVHDPFYGLFTLPLTSDGQTYDELVIRTKYNKKVSMGSGMLLTEPWSANRYRRALLRSGPEWRSSVWKPQRDQTSRLYLPWALLSVGNGNHSAASGWLWGDGVLHPENAYDLTRVLERVDLSPEGLVRLDDGLLIGSTGEWPILALIGLGKRLLQVSE